MHTLFCYTPSVRQDSHGIPGRKFYERMPGKVGEFPELFTLVRGLDIITSRCALQEAKGACGTGTSGKFEHFERL